MRHELQKKLKYKTKNVRKKTAEKLQVKEKLEVKKNKETRRKKNIEKTVVEFNGKMKK